MIAGDRTMREGRYEIWSPSMLLGEDVSRGGDERPKVLGIIGFGRIGQAVARQEPACPGFEIVGERVTALPFEVVFESTGRSRLVRALAWTYHQMARLWPSLFAYQYVLEAEITTLDEESTAGSASISA